ncbi:MAG: hypothetical protein Q7U97_03815, partial [Rhodocyclaceae bacterium]|nr:hypothetical protein [Rhodocyclaceae bacterium]
HPPLAWMSRCVELGISALPDLPPVAPPVAQPVPDLPTKRAALLVENSQIANALLRPSDWQVIRKIERGVDMDADAVAYRANVIAASNANEALINAAVTVEDLAALKLTWPKAPQ